MAIILVESGMRNNGLTMPCSSHELLERTLESAHLGMQFLSMIFYLISHKRLRQRIRQFRVSGSVEGFLHVLLIPVLQS